MDGTDEIVREFLIESNENLDQLDRDLVALESDPTSRDLLSSIFRTIHTIKGTSGFLAFSNLEQVAHVGENLLVELRDGTRTMDQRTTDVLLAMVDTIRALLDNLQDSGAEGEVDVAGPIARIQAVLDDEPERDEPERDGPEGAEVSAAHEEDLDVEPQPGTGQVESLPPASASRAHADRTGQAGVPAPKATSEGYIRVDVELLDELMRHVGELVLVRNQITQLTDGASDDLQRSSQRLSLIASELQDGVMKTRMQPIDHIWAKMPRLVRDLANSLGREVNLEMVGGDTELDRSLLESVNDPLTHLVRNAVDHGIEPADRRSAVGKARTGLLRLSAYHAGGQVIVEVTDDGAGLGPAKVAAAALRRGIRTEEQLAVMNAAEIRNLVFHAGFSTASAVTNVSGRGVGLDVVRSNIEEIGGAVEVESEPGVGTTWRLRIPLTLAILPALTVESRGEIYAIPQTNLQELVALDTVEAQDAIERIGGSEVYRLRGALLPLVQLASVLQTSAPERESVVVAVLEAENQRFGLVVDRVLNNEEIVVKPLSPVLKGIGIYAGATLMGDGRVSLILDVQALARRELNHDLTDLQAAEDATGAALEAASGEYLVVGVGAAPQRRIAIALGDVTRLEQLRMDRIEAVGGREVVQYRGEIVPVLRLGVVLGCPATGDQEDRPTVIFTRGTKTIAMVVDDILEILDDRGTAQSEITDHGLLGSIVLGGAVTELLDTRRVLEGSDPEFFGSGPVAFHEFENDRVMAGV